VDCFIKLNPNFNENQDEERTIEEMQETLFEQQLFEVKNDGRMLTQTGE
jgi:hypothetical protein